MDGATAGTASIRIFCEGAFRVEAPDGTDLTPRGTKACALLAILALTPEMSRPRRWIEGRLWSTRDPEQANASLRQALSEIRRSLGERRDLVEADRRTIALNPDAVEVDVLRPGAEPEPGRDLLEGLNPRDEAFDEWLHATASAMGWAGPGTTLALSPLGGRPTPVMYLDSDQAGSRIESLLSDIVSHQVIRNLKDSAEFVCQTEEATLKDAASGGPIYGLRTSVVSHAKSGYFTLQLSDMMRDRMIWSRHVSVPLNETDLLDSEALYSLAHEAADHAVAALASESAAAANTRYADALVRQAQHEMFTFDAPRLRRAETLLIEADEIRPRALHWAWRSFLRMLMVVERTEADHDLMEEEAETFAAKAIEAEPQNSLILALVSQVRILLQNNLEGAALLADDAMALNKGNAMAHISQATVALRRSDLVEAHAATRRALNIAGHSECRHWWQMFACLAEIASGNYDAAIRAAEAALSYAPKFRPPLRHLYVLYLHRGDQQRAQQIASRLRQLEPDFSLQLIREDQSYPAGTLRRSPLIELQDVI